MSRIQLKELEASLINQVNDANNPFPIIGRMIPSYINGEWTYIEELDHDVKEISFPDDQINWHGYMSQDNRIVYVAMDADECVGQIRIVKDWNRFAYIENIAVRMTYRKQGIGRMLLETAERWAKEKELIGLSLEAQNDNLIACRFYEKEGFQLGGVDTIKQHANPQIDLTLYWYKIF
ncbi:GNAT family N-acetyltransferase [Exiguobacterium aestuarii]|uniref:GNAT family N-acetyltransferase n=1 Tax=Exiguobacterium aestuarii TaxID=273527 RepID=A0ABW2PP00_9BACL|nr:MULTISPECIES: GNAT family N-acetyltransferase [Exiguobacterium]MCT4787381.1 GNAT family N-acetyltransferase [Exiguobacterium aestuarii]